MTAPLRVGVVGVGYLGSIHAAIYAAMDDVELVGVADIDAEVARSVAGRHGCRACTDAMQLVDEVDAVSVAVPTSAHREVAEAFLRKGVHTLLEKPMASTVAEAASILAVADDSGAILQIGHLERFNAGVMALAELVDEPVFIEVHRLGTFVERATDVDVVTDLMIHDIDIVLLLVNAELSRISAVGSPVITEHIDIANARLEFANGTVANVTASRVSTKKFRRIRVFSRHSYQALDFSAQQIEVVRTGEREGNKYPQLITEQHRVTPKPPLDAELEHFVQTVRRGGVPLVTGRDGIEALTVAEQVKETIHIPCLS